MTDKPLQRPAEMAKAYEPQQVEQRLYAWWEASGFFAPSDDTSRPPFVIAMPPPNVTGELHMGHAMFVTIEDILTRWHRMLGDPTLWLPGTDHAGIATQMQVERQLRAEGTSRQAIGREEFLRRTWAWKEKYGGEITTQLRRLGASCDWSRERFTLDPGLSRAVRAAFKRLYDDGLIYRGYRLVNWSPNLQTAVSDLEVEYEERNVEMYYVRYPVIGGRGQGAGGREDATTVNPEPPPQTPDPWGSGRWAAGFSDFITVATTRPETIMGDTAVAVNPDDPRYKHLIGRMVVLPAIGRLVPIIADEHADPEFGTGAVKITPGHDPNDYQVGLRHGLPMINIMNKDATLNEQAGPYAGMERYAARKALLADLEKEGLLAETRPHRMSVGISQRGGEVIEPMLSEQWFVRVAPLAELALAAVREGRTRIIPERFEKVYFHWLENIEDWCISRQLWWGHRIPVWYTPDGRMIVPGPDDPEPQGEGIVQDPDVLDTWFSSGLWPFSTLGWPDDTPDLRRFYPTSVMETGYDILFFWVARMMMLGCYLTGKEPFHTVYLHGLVRDKDGRKMSKSYGNVVNPLDVIEQYGTDALRFTLATSGTPGQDLNLNPERLESARNFANKVWNITRFVLSKGRLEENGSKAGESPARAARFDSPSSATLTLADRWIRSRYRRLVADVDRLMRAYNFGEAGRQIQEFLWSDFADWYVEAAKVQLEDPALASTTRATLYEVLEGALRLLHPFMPFVTEEAWQYLTSAALKAQRSEVAQSSVGAERGTPHALIVAPYPQPAGEPDADAEREFELLRAIISGIRTIRNEYKVEPARWVAARIGAGARAPTLEAQRTIIARLARVDSDQLVIAGRLPEQPGAAATLVVQEVEVVLPLAGMIDLEAERARLRRELEQAEADVARREAKLANAGFVERAPAAVVQRERDGLAAAQATASKLRERLAQLG